MSDIVEALVKEANELPDPNRSLLTHNERELIKFCFRMRDAIQDMREENARLREALKPFSKNYWSEDWHDGSDCEINVQLRDIRRAASLVDGCVWTPDE